MISRTLGISDRDLLALDLKQFNGGRNPYGDGDSSVDNAFKRGCDFYRHSVTHRTGFTGGEKVLDLLCGFGRWSIFLAEFNEHVVGVELLGECLDIARGLCDRCGLDNVEFRQGEAPAALADFSDGEFDFVWMWSALQYVDRGAVLSEISRLLKPKGRLYVGNYNSTGLMLDHLLGGISRNQINDGASQWALNALVHGPQGDGNPNYMTPEGCRELCERFDLDLVVGCPEGGLDLSEGGVRPDFEPKVVHEHYHPTVEFLAEKKPPPPPPPAEKPSPPPPRSLPRRVYNRLRRHLGRRDESS